MKEINKAVDYLKSVSVREPIHIRTEEIEVGRVVLSYEEEKSYAWNSRIYKEFIFKDGEVVAMKSFNEKEPI